VITVNCDRDLYIRHGFHLNSTGMMQTANRVASVIKDLFCVYKLLGTALKWKDKEHRGSYPSVNKQKLGVQDVKANGCENKVLLQSYGNSESVDHIESDEVNKLTGDNHTQTVQELRESICVNTEGIQEDINSEMEVQEITEEDSMKQEKIGLLSKRTRYQP
jgi:hypothetical protein